MMKQVQFDIKTVSLKEVEITKNDLSRLSIKKSMFKPQKKGGRR